MGKCVVLSLALATMVEIVLVFTPASERLLDWLSVSRDPQPADMIVCLGGRYERLLWAARAYHQHYAPRIIVSNTPGAAEFMRDLLLQCGVSRSDILVDNTSRTTVNHPAGVSRQRGVDPSQTRLLLVTDHEHSRRVAAVFRKAGYEHVTIYGGPRILSSECNWFTRVKTRFQYAPRIIYECAALLQYWLQGKI